MKDLSIKIIVKTTFKAAITNIRAIKANNPVNKLNTFESIVEANLKAAGVCSFANMKQAKADKLVQGLITDLSLGNRGDFLVSKLAKCGYFQAKNFLIKTLPGLTIGYEFNKKECDLFHTLDMFSKITLFEGFTPVRAKDMWHAYYKHYENEAVDLLDILAIEHIDLLTKALCGDSQLEEDHVPLVSNILDISNKEEFPLPESLAKLGDPVITKVIKG